MREKRKGRKDTNLQQFEIVKIQGALGAGRLHHVQVVKALLPVS